MGDAVFEVEQVFDIASRGGLVVAGFVVNGVIRRADRLQIEGGRATYDVLGVEPHYRETGDRLLVALLLARTPEKDVLRQGVVLGTVPVDRG